MTDQEILNTFYELYDPCTFECYDKDILEFSRALLSRAIPEGHVVVPKEPTVEMWEDGMNCYSPDDTQGDYLEKAYRAMIAAAPANKEG